MLTHRHQRSEKHHVGRVGWLRAAVLGANDGILSTASLIIGVAAASTEAKSILIAGVAGLVAGSLSMAAGEYASVSSQSDTEKADLDLERRELAAKPDDELAELAAIYVARGLDQDLASKVAAQLAAKDAVSTHARDELGISAASTPKPVQAALASAASFAVGAGAAAADGGRGAVGMACSRSRNCLPGFPCIAGCNRSLGGRRSLATAHDPSGVGELWRWR
jgi:VIT1/CCC1 family predicted Fe2+/Mn2+ transporter